MARGTNADETILHYANKDKSSLKVTVPAFIVSQFKLKKGDKLKWAIAGSEQNGYLKVKPVYSRDDKYE